ncbi:NrsF family protein [Tatumella ptyseos]|uniref:NrsF family protein n=1 Tax=Tatumella ptyseos TaxID=82987 RepID=UPI0026EE0C00|nr:NrsF family protein [Tatumella ptyseos]WKX26422.1 NrsF family protein [Tatumella ptyseos]
MSDHQQLIKQLSHEMQPVNPLAPTGSRILRWIAVALPLAIVSSVVVHRGLTNWTQPGAGLAIAQLVLAVTIGIAAVWNALTLLIPGRHTIPTVRFVLAGGLWLLLNIMSIPAHPPAPTHDHGTFCYLFLMVVSTPMVITLLWTLRQSGGLYSQKSLLMAGISVAAWSVSLLSLCHPVQQDRMDFTLHIAAVATIIGITIVIGRFTRVK